jgi:hypothetical protein
MVPGVAEAVFVALAKTVAVALLKGAAVAIFRTIAAHPVNIVVDPADVGTAPELAILLTSVQAVLVTLLLR